MTEGQYYKYFLNMFEHPDGNIPYALAYFAVCEELVKKDKEIEQLKKHLNQISFSEPPTQSWVKDYV